VTSPLADLLASTRRRHFVGRDAELALFRSALAAPALPFHVLYLHGPGGVGKTSLLEEFGRLCAQAYVPVAWVDGRNVEPSPDAFMQALSVAPPEAPAGLAGRQVLFVDTYESLAPLDSWLRETFLPRLPDQALVVLAGRQPLASAWLSDAGWQALLRRLSLDNLTREESRTYLNRRQVPAEQHADVLTFTHGHPLALSLVADVVAQRPDAGFQPAETPDVVKALVERLLQQVPGPAQRAALEACALLRLTTEALLAAMVAVPDAHELFEWLCGLSFMQMGQMGLFPHDLAREALVAELRWRNPDWYAELHRRARAYYAARLQQTHGVQQQRVLFDYFFLHRDSPVIRPFFEWQEAGTAPTDGMAPADVPDLLAMVAQHEGEDSARLAAHWVKVRPEGVSIFRGVDRGVGGFMLRLPLHEIGAGDAAYDPAVAATLRYLARHAPLRSGETATLFRFWMAREGYQAVSSVQTRVFGVAAQHYLTTPGLAFAFFPCSNPDFWSPALTYADLARLPEADFTVGGRNYAVFGHDWRVTPPLAWLALLAEREIAMQADMATPHPAAVGAVLSREEFAGAVREALRDVMRPVALGSNPLLRSRLVLAHAGADATVPARVAALQALLRDTLDGLRTSPRDAKEYRALYHTYLRPAPTQERAAELLDWSFSTFRRHLKAGVLQVTERLWSREVAGPSGEAGPSFHDRLHSQP
jgi:hypothetical protein